MSACWWNTEQSWISRTGPVVHHSTSQWEWHPLFPRAPAFQQDAAHAEAAPAGEVQQAPALHLHPILKSLNFCAGRELASSPAEAEEIWGQPPNSNQRICERFRIFLVRIRRLSPDLFRAAYTVLRKCRGPAGPVPGPAYVRIWRASAGSCRRHSQRLPEGKWSLRWISSSGRRSFK